MSYSRSGGSSDSGQSLGHAGDQQSPRDLPAAAAPKSQAGEGNAAPEVSLESAGLHDEKPTAAAVLIIMLLPPDDTVGSPHTTPFPAGGPRPARPRPAPVQAGEIRQ
jgi:hypothetical protein